MTKPRNLSDLLPSVDIPLLQPPISGDVENSDGGIGLRHVEHPLVVHIDRPEATPPGTFFQLYWGSSSQPVAFNLLLEGDEGLTRIPFTVSQSHIREAWADPVFVRVLRGTGNQSETKPLRLRVNLRRPGGRDPNDGEPGHQGLVFELPPDVLLDGISETRAQQGVIVTFRYWENMAAYDLITLAWGSQIITRRVNPHEVGQDIQVLVDYGAITQAGNSDLTPVAFQVMGPTGNYPDEWARWSAAQLLDVHLDSNRLDAPWVEFPITERDIDLEQLGNRNVVIGLHVGTADAKTYSLVTLIWAGIDRDGGSVPYTPSEVLYDASRTYYFDIPSALVAAIAQGTVVVHYLLQGADGILDKRSDNRHLRVIGEVIKWPAPTIDQVLGGYLDPTLPRATVRFPVQESWPGDALLEVVFMAGDAEGTVEHRIGREVDDIPPTIDGFMVFTVEGTDLRRFDGYTTEVYYVLTRRDGSPNDVPQESLRLKVQVGEPARDLPKPLIERAVDGLLNPNHITDYAKVFSTFTGTQRGDKITLHWIGPSAQTSVDADVAANGNTTEHRILVDYITPNLDQEVTVFYTLARGDEKIRYSHITTVRISYHLGQLPRVSVLEADPYTLALNLLKPINGATIVVPHYTGMNLIDEITVSWVGAAGTITRNHTVRVLGEQKIIIENTVVNASADRSVTIYYRVRPERATIPSPPSDTLILSIEDPRPTGFAQGTGNVSNYNVRSPVSIINVPHSLPIGTSLAFTPLVNVDVDYKYNVQAATRFRINDVGQQPSSGSGLFPCGVPGVAIRFYYWFTIIGGGVGSAETADSLSWQNVPGQVEFVKVGPVTTGTLEPGVLIRWLYGQNRIHVLSYRLLNRVTFVAV